MLILFHYINFILAYDCGETEEVHQAWIDARAEAWQNGATKEEVHQAVWDATYAALGLDDEADESEEDDDTEDFKTLVCIAVHGGISAGIPECDVIDTTAQMLTDNTDEVSADDAHAWAEEAVAEIYSEWWTSYEEICPAPERKFL